MGATWPSRSTDKKQINLQTELSNGHHGHPCRWLKRFVAGVAWVRISGNPCGCCRTAKPGPWNCAPGIAWELGWFDAVEDYYVGGDSMVILWLPSRDSKASWEIHGNPHGDCWLGYTIYLIWISKKNIGCQSAEDQAVETQFLRSLQVSTMKHPVTRNCLTDNF